MAFVFAIITLAVTKVIIGHQVLTVVQAVPGVFFSDHLFLNMFAVYVII